MAKGETVTMLSGRASRLDFRRGRWHDRTMRTLALVLMMSPAITQADPAVIEAVELSKASNGWRVDVTLRHGDTGWDDYADGWRVLAPDGAELGYRELFHPHVNEQPFTRSLAGVQIPDGLATVVIESRTNTDGWSGETVEIDVPR